MSNLSQLIKTLRENKGFSQRQLAMYAKISNTEISKLESGERQKPNPDILKKIAPFLNVTYDQLMEAAGYFSGNIIEDTEIELNDIDALAYSKFTKPNGEYEDVIIHAKNKKISPEKLKSIIDFLTDK